MLKSKIKHMQGRYIDSRKGTIINGMRHEELFRLCSCADFVVTLTLSVRLMLLLLPYAACSLNLICSFDSIVVSRVRSISSIMPSQLNDSRKVNRAVNEIDKFR